MELLKELSLLNELFDSTFDYSPIGYGSRQGFSSTFNDSNGKKIEVTISHLSNSWEGWSGAYSIDFSRNRSDAITNDGEALKVFSTVVKIAGELIKGTPFNVKILGFGARKSDGNRARLYSRLVHKFAKSHGFIVKTEDEMRELYPEKMREANLSKDITYVFAIKE